MVVCVDGNEYRTANDCDAQKDVPAHFGEAQENGGIQTDFVDQLLLFCLYDGYNPIQHTLANRRRGVFFVGMS